MRLWVLKITDKYFKRLSKNILSFAGSPILRAKAIWNSKIPEPVKNWATPVEIKEKILFIFVKEREKRQSFLGENGKEIVNLLKINGLEIKSIKIINSIEKW